MDTKNGKSKNGNGNGGVKTIEAPHLPLPDWMSGRDRPWPPAFIGRTSGLVMWWDEYLATVETR